jgi:predicted outer membrane repeat protein
VIADGKTGVNIILRGKDAERRVQLSGGGSLFTVKSGVTLVLDKNITLVGINSNGASLVRVDGGNLEMRENAKITGNTFYNSSSSYGGGVYVAWGGTFTMNGSASVSGNTAAGSGGGVYVYDTGGTFTMNGSASVSGNTAHGYGGGVYAGGGTFTMNGSATV